MKCTMWKLVLGKSFGGLWAPYLRRVSIAKEYSFALDLPTSGHGKGAQVLQLSANQRGIYVDRCKATRTTIPESPGARVSRARCDDGRQMISVQLEGSEDFLRFPVVFLRDNCGCIVCKSFNVRPLIGIQYDATVKVESLEVKEDCSGLAVTFDDGHRTEFSPDFLSKHRLPSSWSEIATRKCYDKPLVLWDATLNGELPHKFSFKEVLSDDKVRYQWLETLARYGVAVLSFADKRPGQVQKLGRILHGARNNPYGAVIALKSRKTPNSLAYTGNYLPLHSDLPYYQNQPGIVALHCIEQSEEGGVNLLVDGFHLTEKIQQNHPEQFNVLTTVKFSYCIIGTDVHGDYHFELDRPIIGLDQYGKVNSICHNNGVQNSFINATPMDVQKGYEAYYLLVQMMNEPEQIVEYKMAEGDILTFDNRRLLHGRTAYDSSTNSRYLVQCYFDWDQAYSAMRILRRKLNY